MLRPLELRELCPLLGITVLAAELVGEISLGACRVPRFVLNQDVRVGPHGVDEPVELLRGAVYMCPQYIGVPVGKVAHEGRQIGVHRLGVVGGLDALPGHARVAARGTLRRLVDKEHLRALVGGGNRTDAPGETHAHDHDVVLTVPSDFLGRRCVRRANGADARHCGGRRRELTP